MIRSGYLTNTKPHILSFFVIKTTGSLFFQLLWNTARHHCGSCHSAHRSLKFTPVSSGNLVPIDQLINLGPLSLHCPPPAPRDMSALCYPQFRLFQRLDSPLPCCLCFSLNMFQMTKSGCLGNLGLPPLFKSTDQEFNHTSKDLDNNT